MSTAPPRPFDFNVHLPCALHDAPGATVSDEMQMTVPDLLRCYRQHRERLAAAVDGLNVMLFNTRLFFDEVDLAPLAAAVAADVEVHAFTALMDFRHPDIEAGVDRAAAAGVRGIKLHAYAQEITPSDYPQALQYAMAGAERGLYLCIDTSYGTTRMYTHDNLRLAAYLASFIDTVPIVLLHSGGARVLEALLLALDRPNIWLETSFSVPFYQGSSVEHDLAFAYRKLGPDRVLYASDFPYVACDEAEAVTRRFLDRHGFTDGEIAQIFRTNAQRLLAEAGG